MKLNLKIKVYYRNIIYVMPVGGLIQLICPNTSLPPSLKKYAHRNSLALPHKGPSPSPYGSNSNLRNQNQNKNKTKTNHHNPIHILFIYKNKVFLSRDHLLNFIEQSDNNDTSILSDERKLYNGIGLFYNLSLNIIDIINKFINGSRTYSMIIEVKTLQDEYLRKSILDNKYLHNELCNNGADLNKLLLLTKHPIFKTVTIKHKFTK